MHEEELSKIVKKRIEISKLFYPLTRNEERKWARVFRDGFKALCKRLEFDSQRLAFMQDSILDTYLIWKDLDTKLNEALFCIIEDATSFKSIQDIISFIDRYMPTFTYVIIHQKKDGEGTYDIFRLSKFSYLEHCNRVKLPKRKI